MSQRDLDIVAVAIQNTAADTNRADGLLALGRLNDRLLAQETAKAAARVACQQRVIDAARHLDAIYGEFGTGEAFWQAFRSLEEALAAVEFS